MEELKLNNERENNYCEEEIDLCANDELRLFEGCSYLERYEKSEDTIYSASTGFPSCDGSSKSSRNFNSIDHLCMLIGSGSSTTKSGVVGDECQKAKSLESVSIEGVTSSKRRLGGYMRCDWLVGRIMDLTMMKRLLPSMSKDEYNKFFLAYLSYMVLYSTRKPFSVVKLQIQEDLLLSTSVLGWIDTTFLGSYAFGQLVIPTAFETTNVNEYICVSFICSAVASLVFGISNNPSTLLLCWLFNGLFHAGVYPMLVKYLIACFGVNERGRILGVWTTSQQVGAMVSTAFSASICLKFGWRSVFYIPSVFVFMFGLIVLKYLKKPKNLYIYDNVESNMVLVLVEGQSNFKEATARGETAGTDRGGFESIDLEEAAESEDGARGRESDEMKYKNMADSRSGSSSLLVSPSREATRDGSGEGFGHERCQAEHIPAESSSNGGNNSSRLLARRESEEEGAAGDTEKENDSVTRLRLEHGISYSGGAGGDGGSFGTALSMEKSEFGDHLSYVAELSPTKKNRRQSNRDIPGGDCTNDSVVGEDKTENNSYSSFYIQNVDDVSFGRKLLILLRIPNIINIAISYYFIKLIRYSMLFWLPYYLIRELNYGPSIAGYSSMLFDIGGILGAIFAGAIADTYFGGRRILIACYMAVFVSLSILYFIVITKTELSLPILFGIALMGFCISGPDSILGSTAAQDVFEKSGISIKSIDSMATGIVNGMGAFGAVTQGTLTAYISEFYGWSALFLCLSVFSALSFLILIPASYTKKQKSLV